MADLTNILFIADVVGQPGLDMVISHLDRLKQQYESHLLIANGENLVGGKGLTPPYAEKLFALGIQVITTGNHIWNRQKIYPMLDKKDCLLRPANYPHPNQGKGSCIVSLSSGLQVGVINLQGRSFMYPIDCPFQIADQEIAKMKRKHVPIIFIDFHAEATAEKQALARYLDGKASAFIGTHTHVQTADEQIFPNGTAYITDAGMTGAFYSIIGMNISTAIRRFRTQIGVPYKLAEAGNLGLNAVHISIDSKSGLAKQVERIQIHE